jgi:putative transposase
MKTQDSGVARVLKWLHYPLEVILTCVRWYIAYALSLLHLEEMMAERGIGVGHSTVHRWAIKLLPVLARTIWAILAHDRQYDKDHVSVKPA